MIYGIIVSIIDGKQVAAISSFKFKSLDDFNHYNENIFKPMANKMGMNGSLVVCTSKDNLIQFCNVTGTELILNQINTYYP